MNTPILFLIFNRPDTTNKVFNAIREARPTKLYIAADGPRINVSGEAALCGETRKVVDKIDWPCEVKTLFREKNLGCKYAVSSAITWFFENVDRGIVLEDDCFPSQSFFSYCADLLERYKDDMRIWHISGNNFLDGVIRDSDYSYYFSYYGSIWGWASWANRWRKYDVEMKGYNEIKRKKYLWDIFGNSKEANFREQNFDSIVNGLNTWDFQWAYVRFINSGLSIVPSTNLISNLGFDSNATHTKDKNDNRANALINDIALPLKNPPFVIRDKISDDVFFAKIEKTDLSVLKERIKKIFK